LIATIAAAEDWLRIDCEKGMQRTIINIFEVA
jgi:hypothetical protein